MDRISFQAANAALGNSSSQTAVEISMGGISLECISGSITFAIAGGGSIAKANDEKFGSWSVRTISTGETIEIRDGYWGNWTYLAFAGDIQCDTWLGQTAAHTLSGFGGGKLQAGDEIEIHSARVLPAHERTLTCPIFARPKSHVRVVLGPQDQHFSSSALEALTATRFQITGAYDRMGVRLYGAKLDVRDDVLSIPSEPVVRGAIQVSGDGTPTVLLSDHQTTGGYPKIATIISTDIDGFVQLRPSEIVSFQCMSPQDAIKVVRQSTRVRSDYLASLKPIN
jgi:allophanate hydrolase